MNRTFIGAAVALLAAAAGTAGLRAQAPAPFEKRTYFWYAQMVSLDAGTKTITAKAPIQDAVTQYAGQFKPGEKIMILWSANAGKPETGPVLYAAKLPEMRASKIDSGYIVPVEFVSLDTATKSLTFKVAAPDTALAALKSVAAGQWMKVTASMSQPEDTARVASIEPATQPPAFKRETAPPPPENPYTKKPSGDK